MTYSICCEILNCAKFIPTNFVLFSVVGKCSRSFLKQRLLLHCLVSATISKNKFSKYFPKTRKTLIVDFKVFKVLSKGLLFLQNYCQNFSIFFYNFPKITSKNWKNFFFSYSAYFLQIIRNFLSPKFSKILHFFSKFLRSSFGSFANIFLRSP